MCLPRRTTGLPESQGRGASGQETRLGLQPLADNASALLTIDRPCFGKDVVGNVVRLDAKRVLNDLCGPIAVVTVDGSFQQVTYLRHSSSASRFTAGAAGFLIFTHRSPRPDRYGEPSRFETMPSQPSAQACR